MSQDLPGDTFVGPRFGMWRPTQCVRHGQADEGRRSHHAGHRQVPRGEPCDFVSVPQRGWRCLIGRNVEVGRRSRMSPTSSLVYHDVPSVIFLGRCDPDPGRRGRQFERTLRAERRATTNPPPSAANSRGTRFPISSARPDARPKCGNLDGQTYTAPLHDKLLEEGD